MMDSKGFINHGNIHIFSLQFSNSINNIFSQSPSRLVVHSPSATEQMCELGLDKHLAVLGEIFNVGEYIPKC